MAWTAKGNLTTALAIAAATENPVSGTITQPALIVSTFSTDVADGTELIVALTLAAGLRGCKITWPSNIQWECGNAPHPNGRASSTVIYRFLRNGTVYYGWQDAAGAAAA